jgi:hypothetical protein
VALAPARGRSRRRVALASIGVLLVVALLAPASAAAQASDSGIAELPPERWTQILLTLLGLPLAGGLLARRRLRRGQARGGTRAIDIAALAGCCAILVTFPTLLGLRTGIALLLALAVLAPAIAWLVDDAPSDRRRLLSPLVIFALAFVLVLGSRAILLASGDPGRFFVIDAKTGRTVSSFLAPPETRHAPTFSAVRNPSVEGTTRDWGAPVSNASAGFRGTLTRAPSDGYEGTSSAEASVQTGRGASYVAVAVGEAVEAKADVRPGRIVSAALAVKPLGSRPLGSVALHVAYYRADDRFVASGRVSGAGAHARRTDAAPGRWFRLFGTSRVPRGAVYANLVAVARGFRDHESLAFRLDAARLLPNARSRIDFPADAPPADAARIWGDAAVRALEVSIALLLAVFIGYLLPRGAWLSRRVPVLRLNGLRDRRTGLVLVGFTVVGLVAYAIEMATYGGYGGYLHSFSADPTGGLGKFYIRTLATLATGAAVVTLAHRIHVGFKEPVRALEVGIIVVGLGIAVSYFLKAVIVIPLLTVLLFWHFARRRSAIWLGVSAAVFAILTPFVYQVRSEGGIRPADLVATSYWSEFLTNLQSRFFHFESLMVLIPYEGREHPWQPVADFFETAIPRVLWHGKPLSLDARFTDQYLHGALHARSDVGVISLPGELWLIGGWAGVIVVGIIFGLLLRWVNAMLASPVREPGTVLVAATLLTWLVFTNDGWGLASGAVSVLILAVGWLLPLRRVRDDEDSAPLALADYREPERTAERSYAGR